MFRAGRVVLLSLAVAGLPAAAQVPQPFPRPGSPAPQSPAPAAPVTPAPQPPTPSADPDATPTEATLGVPIYPNAQFLVSYDAGRGQQYYLFGAAASFAELVGYYRTVLKTKGELVFETPATHMFEVGRFREETMVFPPGVTVKDYTWGGLGGYLNPRKGATPERFPTIIQIVPVPPGSKP
jgi:hypothetical protein